MQDKDIVAAVQVLHQMCVPIAEIADRFHLRPWRYRRSHPDRKRRPRATGKAGLRDLKFHSLGNRAFWARLTAQRPVDQRFAAEQPAP